MVHLRALQWGFICHASKILVGSRSNSGMRSARSGLPISSSTAWHRALQASSAEALTPLENDPTPGATRGVK